MEKRLYADIPSLVKRLDVVIKILINTQISSRYRSFFRGKGLEFEDYRVYTPNDDSKRIDWKASMRANEIMVKEFVEERNLNVYLVVDVSSKMIFGSTEKLKMEYAAEVAAAFSYLAIKSGDKAGMIMFNDHIVDFIPPSSGDKHFYMMLNKVLNVKNYGGGFNLEKAVKFLMNTTTERGLLIIVSDFISFKKEWEKLIRIAAVRFDVIGMMIRDPRDETIPKGVGQVVLQDPFSSDTLIIDADAIRSDYEKYTRDEAATIRKYFINADADFIYLTTSEPFIKPLIKFFIKRRERLSR
jgi:uncharacterized protein (DUF58 family)